VLIACLATAAINRNQATIPGTIPLFMGVLSGFDGIFEITSKNASSGSLRRLKSVLLMPCLQE